MALEKYNKKRNFNQTSEPVGKKKRTSKKLRFVIQYHRARAEHYDFRLEYNGVLLSWAVPKGLSLNPKVKRLAVMVEDHPIDYITFEGIIPKGNYGAGTVEIFDKGYYYPEEDIQKGLKKGHIKFNLIGEKLNGGWSLVKTDDKNWLIIKSDDEFASKKEITAKIAKNPFKTCSPMLATLSNSIPKGQNWLFEIKYDGYRIMSFVENNKAKLLSRNGNNYSLKFKSIATSLAQLSKGTPMVLDGEVVCFNENGRSDFGLLQQNIKTKKGGFMYVVFDVLAFNGEDLRDNSLNQRKNTLSKILTNCPQNIMFSSYVNEKGEESFGIAKKLGLEGIVAKDINSTYEEKRSDKWLKIKCYKRQEFVIGGYTTSDKNSYLSALLVGYYTDDKFIFVGKVGTGFSESTKKELNKLFKPLVQKASSFNNLKKEKDAVWVSPKLIAEIQYTELTKDHLLRQPSYIGLRNDKSPKDVKLEMADE